MHLRTNVFEVVAIRTRLVLIKTFIGSAVVHNGEFTRIAAFVAQGFIVASTAVDTVIMAKFAESLLLVFIFSAL